MEQVAEKIRAKLHEWQPNTPVNERQVERLTALFVELHESELEREGFLQEYEVGVEVVVKVRAAGETASRQKAITKVTDLLKDEAEEEEVVVGKTRVVRGDNGGD